MHKDNSRVGYSKEYAEGFAKIDWGNKKDDADRSEVPRKDKDSRCIPPVGHQER